MKSGGNNLTSIAKQHFQFKPFLKFGQILPLEIVFQTSARFNNTLKRKTLLWLPWRKPSRSKNVALTNLKLQVYVNPCFWNLWTGKKCIRTADQFYPHTTSPACRHTQNTQIIHSSCTVWSLLMTADPKTLPGNTQTHTHIKKKKNPTAALYRIYHCPLLGEYRGQQV